MIRTWYKDEWLVTRGAAKLVLLATVAVIALTAVLFFGKTDTNAMSLAARLPVAVLGVVGPIALFFLWFGMWRYWVRLDRCSKDARGSANNRIESNTEFGEPFFRRG
jgi:hypothetical protein